jgi:hypothetical protein
VGILNEGKLVAKGTIAELAEEGVQAEGRTLSLEDVYMRYFQEQ